MIKIHVEPDNRWTREGHNVVSNIALTYPEVYRGCKVKIDTLWGEQSIDIPAKSQIGSRIVLAKKGAPYLNRMFVGTDIERGDHIVQISLCMPNVSDPKHSSLLDEMQKFYA